MRKSLFLASLACLAMTACQTATPGSSAPIGATAVTKASAAFARIRPLAEAAAAMLPATRAAQVHQAIDAIALLLAVAQAATTPEVRLQALAGAEAQTAALIALTQPPPQSAPQPPAP